MSLNNATVLITPSSGGKDYFLEILEEALKNHDKEITNIKFASATRKIVMKILFSLLEKQKLLTPNEINELSQQQKEIIFDEYKNHTTEFILWRGKNVRNSLQYIAESLKAIDPNIHIGFAFKEILESKRKSIPVVTDGRFHNEINAMVGYNSSTKKEEFIRKFISNLKLPDNAEFEAEVQKIFTLKDDNDDNIPLTTEDKKIIKLINNEVAKLYKYTTYPQESEESKEYFDLETMDKEDFLEKNIIILTRYITEKDVEKQKEQYKKHGIDFNDPKYKINNELQRYLGSAHPEHIAEILSFQMPIGFLNATDSPNLKANLLPRVIEKTINKSTKRQNKKTGRKP